MTIWLSVGPQSSASRSKIRPSNSVNTVAEGTILLITNTFCKPVEELLEKQVLARHKRREGKLACFQFVAHPRPFFPPLLSGPGIVLLPSSVWAYSISVSTTKHNFSWEGQTVLTQDIVYYRRNTEPLLTRNRPGAKQTLLHSHSCPQGIIITTNKLGRNYAAPHCIGDQELLPLLATSGKSFQRLCPNLSSKPTANCS